MTLQALLFDLDGTLVDTEELHRLAFNEAFRQARLNWDWGHGLYKELLGVSGGAERIAAYIDLLDATAAEKTRLRRQVRLIHSEKIRIYREFLQGGCPKPRIGVARLIKEAHAAGLKIGIAATSDSANALELIQHALDPQARAAIGAIVCSDQVARKKPAPDMYELLVSALRISVADCVAFEDSENGLAAAKAAGLYTVVTPSSWTLTQDFSSADLVLPMLGEPQKVLDSTFAEHIGGSGYLGLAQLEQIRGRPALREIDA